MTIKRSLHHLLLNPTESLFFFFFLRRRDLSELCNRSTNQKQDLVSLCCRPPLLNNVAMMRAGFTCPTCSLTTTMFTDAVQIIERSSQTFGGRRAFKGTSVFRRWCRVSSRGSITCTVPLNPGGSSLCVLEHLQHGMCIICFIILGEFFQVPRGRKLLQSFRNLMNTDMFLSCGTRQEP